MPDEERDFAKPVSDARRPPGQEAAAAPASHAKRIAGSGSLLWILSVAVIGVPLLWSTSVVQAFSVPKESLFYLVLAAGIALWALDLKADVALTAPWTSGDRAGLAFLALSAISLTWAYSPALGLRALGRLFARAVFYSLLVVALDSGRRVKMLLSLFTATVGIAAAYGLFQFYDMFNYPGRGRPFLLASFGHPNYASTFVGVGFPLLVALLLISHGWRRALAFAGTCVGFAFLLVAQTRSVWVAMAIALTVGGLLIALRAEWRRRIRESRSVLIALAVNMLVILLIFSVESPLNRRISVWSRAAGLTVSESQEHVTVSSRWLIWKAAWFMIRDHPLLGVGIGNFAAHSAEYVARARESSPWLDPRYRSEFFHEAHNDYLHIWTELGLAGLITFLLFIGWHLDLAYRRLTRTNISGQDALWLIGAISSLLVHLIDSLFNIPFFVLSSGLACLVLLASIRRMACSKEESQASLRDRYPGVEPHMSVVRGFRVSRNVVVATSLVISAGISVGAAATYLADSYASRGQKAAHFGDYQASIVWYDMAVRANPLEYSYRVARGGVYAAALRYKEGLDSLKQAELFLKRASIAEKMGVAYAGLGDATHAEAEYRRALRYQPDNPEAREYLVYLFLNQERFADAAKEAAEGIRWNPDRGRLHLYLATAQAALGQEGDALAGAQTAGEMLPGNRTVFALLYNLASRSGKADLADAADRRLRAITQYDRFQHILRFGEAGVQASVYLLNAIAEDAEYADPHFDMGIIAQGQGMTQEAIAEFSAYLRRAPRGDRARQAQRFITSLQHPSWLVNTFRLDARSSE